MKSRIGYLSPVFPGQKHIFFWREYTALENKGVQLDLISTRRPPQQIMSHMWTGEALRNTTYLSSPTQYVRGRIIELIHGGPLALARYVRAS
jgi:colanic acid/amylovoran biosynthesis glycosyltransferase